MRPKPRGIWSRGLGTPIYLNEYIYFLTAAGCAVYCDYLHRAVFQEFKQAKAKIRFGSFARSVAYFNDPILSACRLLIEISAAITVI